MVDETAFHRARQAAIALPCVFERALLVCDCRCALARRQNLAEREGIGCLSLKAQAGCTRLRELLLRNATFALKLPSAPAPIPHAKQLKAQCGGLHGLAVALTGREEVSDVAMLVLDARNRFGSLEALPYSEIVRSIASFEVRRRHPDPRP